MAALFGVVKAVHLLVSGLAGDLGHPSSWSGFLTFLRTRLRSSWPVLDGAAGRDDWHESQMVPALATGGAGRGVDSGDGVFSDFGRFLVPLPAGIDIAAILLMLLGTQWYMLFNVIAGAMAIPADLREAAYIYQVTAGACGGRSACRRFPYLVTGLITASGGAWNASVVAEYISATANFHARGLGPHRAGRREWQTRVAAGRTLTMAAIVASSIAWSGRLISFRTAACLGQKVGEWRSWSKPTAIERPVRTDEGCWKPGDQKFYGDQQKQRQSR